jgi:ABC-type cobalamin/Fe3+-siderophores transport system ATPase subunit
MKATLPTTLLLALVSLGACQSGWVRLDGAQAENAALEQARSTCQVDQKMSALEQARAENSVQATKTSSNEARMQQLDSFETESFILYQQINDCMQREGYRKP